MSARFALEHFLWTQIKAHHLVGRQVLISVSGGADSMAVARAWSAVRPASEISWVHVHHGLGGSRGYRERAKAFVQEQASVYGVKLFAMDVEAKDQSEASLRSVRREAWKTALSQMDEDAALVTGHHLQDLLETRLIRLIRGSGSRGFASFSERKGRLFRPFLQKNSTELRFYLKEREQSWVEDPSNLDLSPLRNWIRHHWLSELEKKRQGSIASLGRSLELLAQEISRSPREPLVKSQMQVKMRYEDYFAKSAVQRRDWIASVFQAICQRGFQKSHVIEVERRLQERARSQTFRTADLQWTFDRDFVRARRVLSESVFGVGPSRQSQSDR